MNLKRMLMATACVVAAYSGIIFCGQSVARAPLSPPNSDSSTGPQVTGQEITRTMNNYRFNDVVANKIIVDGKSVGDAINKADAAIPGGMEPVTPYQHSDTSPLVLVSPKGYDYQNIRIHTLMLGGATRNALVGLKATCQNTSGGDIGGSCYQFTDMGGPQIYNRGGAGLTDGINVDIRSKDNSPLDVIGGNQLITEANGMYRVAGNVYALVDFVPANATSFKIKGTFGCGMDDNFTKAHCEMTGIAVVNRQGNVLKTVRVSPGAYDSDQGTTLIKLPNGLKVKNRVNPDGKVKITYYSADGVAYGVVLNRGNTIIYPALSDEEKNLIHDRIAIWTNITDGMAEIEGGMNEEHGNIDIPNYYYGYNAGIFTVPLVHNQQVTTIKIEGQYYPGTGGFGGWRTLKKLTTPAKEPGKNPKDQLDYKVTFPSPTRNQIVHNTNFHRYAQPALFLGLNRKNFNLYALQAYYSSPDSITREFDNEWDFWFNTHRDYEISTRGLTMTWPSRMHKKFAVGSYMIRLAGMNSMPIGLQLDGVWPDGGKLISTDGGFTVFKWTTSTDNLDKIGAMEPIIALGQAKTQHYAYQLFSYMSNDGDTSKETKQNNSLHFGLTKKRGSVLNHNESPTCKGDKKCLVLGQIIFDPLGYSGGIALGSGQGGDTRLGLVVDNTNNVIINNQLLAPKVAAAQFVGQLSTPASSSAPCEAGQFMDDTQYHYVCVATNKWKRVALSAF